MSYYQALGLWREPFSNSPDPELLYRSKKHLECLQHMEIAVRLRRGLNVVLGEVGTGKTTLGRELMRLLGQDRDIEVHFLDDPYYPTPVEFLMALLRLFGRDERPLGRDMGLLREAVKAALLEKSADGQRIVALIIDEGQKITGDCLELLRELLNFETNTHKLLQIVIFAQTEFEPILAARPNLEDRVNFRYSLLSLDRMQTRRLIETRLALCSTDGHTPPIFTGLAMRRIHRLAKGYPRKIVRLCHLSMLLAVGLGKTRIGWSLVGRAARQSRGTVGVWLRRAGAVAALGGVTLLGLGLGGPEVERGALRAVSVAQVYLKARVVGVGAGGSHAVVSALHDPAPVAALPAETIAAVDGPPAPSDAVPRELAFPVEGLSSALTTPETLDLAAAALASEQTEQVIVIPVEQTGPAALSANDAGVGSPNRLGKTHVRVGWPVTRLAARIYGYSGRRALSELAKANPGVDFDRIRADEILEFPALEANPLPAGACLVKVGEARSLEEGITLMAKHRDNGPTLSIFSTYHPASGLRFDVVLAKSFSSREAAETGLAELPKTLAAKAGLVDGYPDGTRFFTELRDQSGKRPELKPGAPIAGRQVAVSLPVSEPEH
ncbi:MAG: AAA family ATPase [Solidesulfovibrio sp.]